MSAAVVTLTFPAKPDYLVLSRLALSGLARAYPFDPDVLADLKLAITEACGNAVRHAYEDEAEDGPVTVSFRVDADTLEILVEDRGSGLVSPDREWTMPEEPESGMGLAIIRTVVDELDVSRGDDGRGTVVRMTKSLGEAAAS
jgi:serine/threonine-protein kinase RsbW